MVAVQVCSGRDFRGIQAGIGLSHPEAGFFPSRDQGRQHALFLFLGAEDDHRIEAEDVDVDGRRPRHRRP